MPALNNARAFSRAMKIRFSHCDPAGIVYFPNFFDMFNALLEDWYTEGLGIDYERQVLIDRHSFPIVHADCDFRIPSRMGDSLTMTLLLDAVGTSSMRFTIVGHVGPQERLRGHMVVALVSRDTAKSKPLPAELRAKVERYAAQCRGWSLVAETAAEVPA
jgi:4-hydroxybenzoyl-CoA thioesterase